MKFKLCQLRRTSQGDYKIWKKFLEDANGATIFHDPDFLSYHNNKFNEHHLGILKGETLFGIIPMAIVDSGEEKIAKSPYGASFGGFIFRKVLNYSDSKEIITIFLDYLKKLRVNKILITPPPSIYYHKYCETFLFCMLESGFRIINADITSIVCLNNANLEYEVFTSRARNMARKARKAGVEIVKNADIDDFWIVMEKTFKKHKTNPTHNKEEFRFLHSLFPQRIYCDVAYLDNRPIAGIGYFVVNNLVNMSFYLCSDPEYQKLQPLSYLIYEALLDAQEKGFKFFDFGTSSVNMQGRENIFRFKESFGAIGRFRITYSLEI